jgi:hypothetical protein
LIRNPDIHKGDIIIVYYAGHGSRVESPPGWPSTDGKIETWCPCNERVGDVHGITDRAINSLLSEIATAKGHNVVCISDYAMLVLTV